MKVSDLKLRRAILIWIYSLGPLCHFIAVPARTVGIRLLHLRVELPTVSKVVDRLEGEGGLVPGEVQWEVHYEGQMGRCREGQIVYVAVHFRFLAFLTVHKEAKVLPHEEKSEFRKPLCIVLHHAPGTNGL